MSEIMSFLQFQKCDRKIHQELVDSINENRQDSYLLERMKELFKEDYLDFLDIMENIYQGFNTSGKDNFYPWLIENSDFTTYDEIDQEFQYYHFFKKTISNISKYQNISTPEQALELCQAGVLKEDIVRYAIANYYLKNKLTKRDFITRDNQGKVLYQLIDEFYHQDDSRLKQVLETIYEDKQKENESIKNKKLDKIVQKTYKKLRTNHYSQDELQQLKQATINKLLHFIDNEHPLIMTVNEAFEQHDNKHQTAVKEEITKPIIETANHNHDENELQIIEEFYHQHHFYYKKSQIIQEINTYNQIIAFYHRYLDDQKMIDGEERIKKYEELVSDLKDSSLKKTESLRRLLSGVLKDIDDYINTALVSDNLEVEEKIIEPVELENREIITIGKFLVYKETAQANPMNIDKIVALLAPDDQSKIETLKLLIYQIGYDKIHAYLLKKPYMYLDQLQSYIKLDRSLRFEYQRILEDVEMYFRSSLTSFLSDKYDQKYLTVESKQWFYKRGYLMRNIFIDPDEHYDLVKQLRERIDSEMKYKNLQVIEEFSRYKYALSFFTAAGIMPFGWMVNMFENLNYHDKQEYIKNYFYDITPQTFCNWMISLSHLRNRCAHYQSLYRLSSLKELRYVITKECDANGYDDDYNHSSLFYYTLVMTRLSPEVNNIEDYIDAIGILFRKAQRENDVFDLKNDYSFPKQWRSILENEKSSRIY